MSRELLPSIVKITSDGRFTKVIGPNGESVEATSVRFEHVANENPFAAIAVLAVPIEADNLTARYELFDPNTQQKKEIASIRFVDGTEWNKPDK